MFRFWGRRWRRFLPSSSVHSAWGCLKTCSLSLWKAWWLISHKWRWYRWDDGHISAMYSQFWFHRHVRALCSSHDSAPCWGEHETRTDSVSSSSVLLYISQQLPEKTVAVTEMCPCEWRQHTGEKLEYPATPALVKHSVWIIHSAVYVKARGSWVKWVLFSSVLTLYIQKFSWVFSVIYTRAGLHTIY